MNLKHPNPTFRRDNFILLDGEWEFMYKDTQNFSDDEIIRLNKLTDKIIVPFTYETK